MAWVYLDDHFPEHPKVLAAGGDAAWLFVAILAWCRRQPKPTEGRIPKAAVARLTDRRNPDRLARRLAEVALLEDDGDHWQVHDWRDWNGPAEAEKARKAKARKAAQARWEECSSNAQASALALPEHELEQSPSSARAMPPAGARASVPLPNPLRQELDHSQNLGVAPPGAGSELRNGHPRPPTRAELVKRLTEACSGDNREFVAREAGKVVAWYLAHVDARLLDEAIGALASQREKPMLPRALGPYVAKRAKHAPGYVA